MSALPVDEAVCADVDGELVAVFHTSTGFYALAESCLHMGGPLSEGHVAGITVVCPWHGWRYDLATGERLDRRGQATTTYPIEVRDGWLYLGLSTRSLILAPFGGHLGLVSAIVVG